MTTPSPIPPVTEQQPDEMPESREHALLKEHFGWDRFLDGQREIVQRLLAGQSALAVFPTGGGKSLCYQLPALALDGITVVVSPLIALMKDQIDALARRNIPSVRLDSSLSREEYLDGIAALKNGTAKLLYVAPERLFNERFRSTLESLPVSLLAVDEAHCISQWGHNFRPDYLKLPSVVEWLNHPPVLALTATATDGVQRDICSAFDIEPENVTCNEFFRSNLHLRCRAAGDQPADHLVERIKGGQPGPTIVYVTLQKTAEQVAQHCAAAGLNARAYHAGMDPDQRNEIQQWFMEQPDSIIVATIAFGMGVDKSNIRYVYHFNPPKSLENYAQEIGRAGRDGNASVCEILLNPADRITLENFVYGDTPSTPSLIAFVGAIAAQPDNFFISHYSLAKQCNIRSLVMRTLLTYLELDGWITATSPRYDSYSFKPLVSSQQMLGNFEGERRTFVAGLLACSEKRKTWFGIDIPAAMEKLNCDRSRVVSAFEYFAEQGWIELKTSGLVHGYRRLKPIDSPRDLVESLASRVTKRERDGIKRIDRIFELASATSCMAAQLSEHFGQQLESGCGECTFCLGEGPVEVTAGESEYLSPETIQIAIELSSDYPEVVPDARVTAAFLCGIRLPALVTAKLSSHEKFGICESIPMSDVVRQLLAAGFQNV